MGWDHEGVNTLTLMSFIHLTTVQKNGYFDLVLLHKLSSWHNYYQHSNPIYPNSKRWSKSSFSAYERVRISNDKLFWFGGVWLYSIMLVLHSFVLCLTLVQNAALFPIIIWQKGTKWGTKVVIHGNLVLTKVIPKGITNRSTLKVHDCQIEYKLKLNT